MVTSATSRSYRWVVWLAVLVPVLLVLGSGIYAAGALPGCTSCHLKGKFAQQTAASAHAETDCAACHVPKGPVDRLGFGFRQVFHMAVPVAQGRGRDWVSVPDSQCLSCHQTVTEEIVEANGIRIDHSVCAEGSKCTDCHSTTAHGTATTWPRVYDMETCLECHASLGISECNTCHAGKRPDDRITSGVFAVTHGPDWQKTHGMGNSATCTACHTGATCEKCHGPGLPHDDQFVDTHAKIAASPEAKCETCHERRFCDDCHGLAMPHTTQFTRGHAKPATEDPAVCKRCHVDSDCIKCHETHVHPGGAVSGSQQLSPWKTGER